MAPAETDCSAGLSRTYLGGHGQVLRARVDDVALLAAGAERGVDELLVLPAAALAARQRLRTAQQHRLRRTRPPVSCLLLFAKFCSSLGE